MEKEKDVLTIENGVVADCDKSTVNVVIPEGLKSAPWRFRNASR